LDPIGTWTQKPLSKCELDKPRINDSNTSKSVFLKFNMHNGTARTTQRSFLHKKTDCKYSTKSFNAQKYHKLLDKCTFWNE